MIEIMIDLQGGARAPLYEKIYEYIKSEIAEGKISRGEKLPSTRLLARNLSVSRSTVEMAYEQLLAEGYIKAEPCRGFFVCDITELYQLGEVSSCKVPGALPGHGGGENQPGHRMPGGMPVHQRSGEAPDDGDERAECPPEELKVDFSPYAIDTENFPYNVWRKISRNVLLDDREELLLSGDGRGEEELRRAIAGYLHQARGVNCLASDIILGAGNEYLEILLTQLLGRDKTILMENPGYPQAYRTFCNMGYEVRTVEAGEQGLGEAQVRRADPDLVYMMPSHQFPLGTVMPLKERLELLKWASEKEERYLIEDDHDSEYRYRGKPIPSLQSVDRFGKVIYLGTFSKSIAPSLRISYMVLPPRLMEKYRSECGFYSTTVPRMQQEILEQFIRDGHFERHLNKMRGVYRGKHDFLLGELKGRGWVKKVSGDHAGLHVLVETDSGLTEEEICIRALAQGVKVSGITEYHLGENTGVEQKRNPVLLLGYGKLCEAEIKMGLDVLDTIFDSGK